MRCVHIIGSVHLTGRNHLDGWFLIFYGSDLYWRSLCSQYYLIINIEGILFPSCGMILRDVQRFEVIIVQFHFRSLFNGESHFQEDVLNLLHGHHEGVFPAHG